MKKLLIVLLCLGLAGCALGQTISRASVRSNLNKLDIGMSKAETLGIMGKSYKTETLQGKDKVFLVLYYVSDTRGGVIDFISGDANIADDELTPLVFDEGKLIGWGWSFLKDNVQKYELRLR